MSRPLKVKVILVQGHSRSQSFSSQGHFQVKVILESNGNVFQFLPRSGWLAFGRMLIITCIDGKFVIFMKVCYVCFVYCGV